MGKINYKRYLVNNLLAIERVGGGGGIGIPSLALYYIRHYVLLSSKAAISLDR